MLISGKSVSNGYEDYCQLTCRINNECWSCHIWRTRRARTILWCCQVYLFKRFPVWCCQTHLQTWGGRCVFLLKYQFRNTCNKISKMMGYWYQSDFLEFCVKHLPTNFRDFMKLGCCPVNIFCVFLSVRDESCEKCKQNYKNWKKKKLQLPNIKWNYDLQAGKNNLGNC